MKTKIGIVLLTGVLCAYSADMAVPGRQVNVLVTVEAKGQAAAALSKDDIRVVQDKESRPVIGFEHVDSGATQMLLLIDDSAGGSFDTQISELKKFVTALPANVAIGIGYMHNGMAEMVSNFTVDHAKAAGTIRLPEGAGGADVSPYDSLSDAIKRWPTKDGVTRREVIMISSGIDGLDGGFPPNNPYVNAGIASAQRAGVVVYAIYNPSSGHAGHSFWRGGWGQNLLSQLTDETGGELYEIGTGSAVSFESYFQDILKRQAEQYILTFEARAEKKSGLQPVRISSAVKGTSLAAPDKVFVKAGL